MAALVAAACLLSSCGGSAPATQTAARRALRGEFSGEVRDRVRKIDLFVDKEGVYFIDRDGIRCAQIVAAQGDDVELTIVGKDGAYKLEFDQFYREETPPNEIVRGQSSPATSAADHVHFEVEVKPGEKTVVILDADGPGTFPILCASCGHLPDGTAGSVAVRPRMFVLRWVARYGLMALFVLLMFGIAGIPMPDEVMLSFAGGLAATCNYNMDYVSTLLTAWLGASCGITFSYVLGRTAGLGVVHKWGKYLHVTEERLSRVHEWFEHKKGRWALVFCVYAPVFRHLVAIVAGTSRMRLWEFALLAYTGVLMWVATFITLGFFVAGFWLQMGSQVHYALLIGSLAFGALILVWFILKNRRDHRKFLSRQAAAREAGKGDASSQS